MRRDAPVPSRITQECFDCQGGLLCKAELIINVYYVHNGSRKTLLPSIGSERLSCIKHFASRKDDELGGLVRIAPIGWCIELYIGWPSGRLLGDRKQVSRAASRRQQ